MFNAQRPEVLDRNSPWTTSVIERTVLAVVHNVTAATRLFDILPVIADDPRIQVHFTCPESSPFHGQIVEYFSAREVTPVPWKLASETRFDLAVAASHGGPLNKLRVPLIIIPHGIGYNKYLDRKPETGNRKPETGNRKPETGNRKPETGNRKPVFGMAPEWLLHQGRPIASSLVLSHPEQLDRLRQSCPEAAAVAVVAGDPCFDRMLASTPLRSLYRDALGVGSSQRLILVSSTWGPSSLHGKQPELVSRLRSELPLDDYAIAVALHPNIWSAHTPWQIRRWLNACVRSGVHVFPADEGWRAGLVAADLVVGDHGSVTFYGASLGRPVLLAERPHETVDPVSAIGRFLAVADALDSGQPLRPQIDRATTRRRDAHLDRLADLTTSAPLKAHALLRSELYRLLRLEEPTIPAEPAAVPIPVTSPSLPAVQQVHVTLERQDQSLRATAVRLSDNAVEHGRPLADGAHLVVSTDEPAKSALQLADVIVHNTSSRTTDWIGETLSALPGSALVTRPGPDGTWLVGDRDGHLVRFEHTGHAGPVLASVVFAWIAGGSKACELPRRVEILLGGKTHQVDARPAPCRCSSGLPQADRPEVVESQPAVGEQHGPPPS
ncbi:hypothetical protein JNUCC0626_47570 [Lentzea sp. JNUCC 0626]|uniref:hypothetical protein n=1 Tax=Lentzea sp. JNUCC 0626 TaxID=3367513 RepID=UPI00374992B3